MPILRFMEFAEDAEVWQIQQTAVQSSRTSVMHAARIRTACQGSRYSVPPLFSLGAAAGAEVLVRVLLLGGKRVPASSANSAGVTWKNVQNRHACSLSCVHTAAAIRSCWHMKIT